MLLQYMLLHYVLILIIVEIFWLWNIIEKTWGLERGDLNPPVVNSLANH